MTSAAHPAPRSVTSRFAAVLPPHRVTATSPDGQVVLDRLAAGNLTAACRHASMSRVRDRTAVAALARELATSALGRWDGRARRLMDWAGALPLQARTLLADHGGHVVHVWPAGTGQLWPGDSRRPTVTACGLDADELRRAPRGAWQHPPAADPARPESDARWVRCATCTAHTDRFPETAERPDDPLLATHDAFGGLRGALAATLRDDLERDQALATMAHARARADETCRRALVPAVAHAASLAGLDAWLHALGVTSYSWSRGLSEAAVRHYLPGVSDPAALLNAADWETALGAVPLSSARGRGSRKQTVQLRRELWHATLRAHHGLPPGPPAGERPAGWGTCF